MGGVPVLLLVAALGVDYGWQPDGVGGVEYVIQVPPDQWDHVKQVGEISSVIDPQVQGRVSRVIIRVGTEKLPRIAPARAQSTSEPQLSNIAAADLVPMPIPSMSDVQRAIPIPGKAATQGVMQSANEAVMKPDPSDPPGSGFSLPPTLQDAANQASNAMRGAADQFQQNLATAAQSQLDTAMNQLRPTDAQTQDALNRLGATAREAAGAFVGSGGPAITGDPSLARGATGRDAVPPFTGADPSGAMARARGTGPTTDPAADRSADWRPLGSTPTQPQAAAPGTFGNTAANPNSSAFNPGSNFGRVPESLRSSEQSGPFATNPNTNNASTNPNLYTQTPSNFGSGAAVDPRSSAAAGGMIGGAANPYNTPGFSTPNFANNSSSSFDPNLTREQVLALPPGAFSFNAFGVPVDRNGVPVANNQTAMGQTAMNQTTQPYPNYNPTAAQTSPYNASPYAASPYPPTQGWANGPTTSGLPTTGASTSLGSPNVYPGQTLAPTDSNLARYNQPADNRLASAGTSMRTTRTEDELMSSSDLSSLRTSPSSLSRSPVMRPTVAAQPFFNGLLLLSIVANFYLIFWLKNLRHQFRDLVAAKRMAQPNNPAS